MKDIDGAMRVTTPWRSGPKAEAEAPDVSRETPADNRQRPPQWDGMFAGSAYRRQIGQRVFASHMATATWSPAELESDEWAPPTLRFYQVAFRWFVVAAMAAGAALVWLQVPR